MRGWFTMGDPPDVRQEVAEYISKEPASREGKYGAGAGGEGYGGGSWVSRWIVGGFITLIVVGGLLYWLTSGTGPEPEEPAKPNPPTEVPPPSARPQPDVGRGVPEEFPNFGVKLDAKVQYPPLDRFFSPKGDTAGLNEALEDAGYQQGVRGVYSNGESGRGYTVAVINGAQLGSDASVPAAMSQWATFIESLSTEPKREGDGTKNGFDYEVWVAEGPQVGTGFTDIYILASRGPILAQFNVVGPTGRITTDKAIDNVAMSFEQWFGSDDEGGRGEPEQPTGGGQSPSVPPGTEPPPTGTPAPPVTDTQVQAFLDDLAAAVRTGDADFLASSLAPEVTSAYGSRRCEGFVSSLTDESREYHVLGVKGPASWTWKTNHAKIPVNDVYRVKVRVTVHDEEISSTVHLEGSADGLRWFAECGTPASSG